MTYVPPDLSAEKMGQYVVRARNVRAEFGVLKAAPGFERVHLKERNLDAPANLIFQPEILGVDKELRTTPVVGTEGKLFTMRRRGRELVCSDCATSFAVLGDSGKLTPGSGGRVALQDVATLIQSWSPEFVVHTGDLVYHDGGADEDENPYEAYVAQFFYPYIGGYTGTYGKGPASNKFFPCMGNHDWTDGPGYRYLEAYRLPPPERYYTFKKGPCQFFVLNSYGYGPSALGPGATSIGGTGAAEGVGEADLSWPNSPQAQWLQEQVALSDSAWRIVVFHHPANTSETTYWPGYSVMDWPWEELGIDLVLNGHAHCYERIERNGVTRVVCGLGGHSRRAFVTPPVYVPIEDELGILLTDENGAPLFAALPNESGDTRDYVEGSSYRYSDDYGALRVNADRGTLVGRFYTRDGELVDSFTLTAQRVSTSCYIGDSGRRVTTVEVVPEAVTTEVGGVFQFLAYAYYEDGSREDVTASAAWTVGDSDVISVDQGKITGLTPGTTTVTATFSGASDSSDVEVLVQCVDAPADIMLVLDESYSMLQSSGGASRIARLKEASRLLVDALLNGPGDRLGMVSFSGEYSTQTPGVTMHAPLGENMDLVRQGIDKLSPNGATSTAAGIQAGLDELNGPRHLPGRRRVMILFTDGYPNVIAGGATPPTAETFEDALNACTEKCEAAKADGIAVMVVGLDLRHNPVREAIVSSWATEGFYYGADSADELLAIFSTLLGDLCREGYYYQTTTPLSVGDELLYA